MKMVRRGAVLMAVMLLSGPAAAGGRPSPGDVDWEAVSRESVDLLRAYVRIPSVNPPADTRATAAFLKEILQREGIEARLFERVPGKVNLLARLKASPGQGIANAGPLLLLHHMDVVPVDAARWPVDPFGGEIKDGFIQGRGTADMKGVGILHLMVMLTLQRRHVPLSRDVLLMATADEETGGHDGARWMIEHLGDELRPEYVLDEGGFGSRDVMAADGRLVYAISVGEKKMLWLRVKAAGTAGHGSQPIDDNANDRMATDLAAILGRVRGLAPRKTPVVAELSSRVGELADNKFTRALQRDTVSLTTMRSGVGDPPKVNVIPSVAEATFDCRLLPDTDADQFVRQIFDLGNNGMVLETVYRMDDTPVTPHDTDMFRALEGAILAEHPGAVVAPTLIPYGTDSNVFRVHGAKAYGLNPMVVDASIIASLHSDNERVPEAEMGRGARILYDAVLRMVSKMP